MIVNENIDKIEEDLSITDIEGNRYFVQCEVTPVYDIKSEYFGAVIALTDVTAQNMEQEKMKFLYHHDQLTGLYNQSYYEEMVIKLDTDIKHPISVIVADINGLRLINRAFGKELGDELLIEVSEGMKKVVKDKGIITRVRGHIFIIILPNTGRKTASQYIEDMKGYIRETNYLPVEVSISFGFASKEDVSKSIQEIVTIAEEEVGVKKALESRHTRDSIINSLLKRLMSETHETKEHGDAIKYYSKKIAQKMNLSQEDRENLLLLAYTHDLGKFKIPDHILNKKEELTEDEWRIMQSHVFYGYQMALETAELSKVASSILSHHEKWDGSGYPQKLKGKSIPILARIIAVVDAFDSMTSERTYREEMSRDEAIKEIMEQANKAYDPKVVKAFKEVLEEE
jgi:diguanylate cyclase (GGDEF)-like protein